MSLIAIVVLFAACFAYIFWPERNPFAQADKTRVDSLRERKEAIYENLRDLNFEHLAGKFTEADYEAQRSGLEDEAAAVVAEIELLQARGMRSGRLPKKPTLMDAYNAMASMPEDFFKDGRRDPPPEPIEPWDD